MTKVNLGVFTEIATEKVDRDLRNVDLTKTDVVIEYQEPTEENNYTWYRLYASGWVAQGGHINFTGSDYTATVVLPIIMADTNYNLTGGELSSNAVNGYHSHIVVGYDKTITGFKSHIANTGQGKDWLVTGKADMTGHEILPSKKAIDEYDHRVIAFQKPTADNNYTWYRKYADGWVEQGGTNLSLDANGALYTVNLPIAMANENYTVIYQAGTASRQWATNQVVNPQILNKTTTSFACIDNLYNNTKASWQVSGMAAE